MCFSEYVQDPLAADEDAPQMLLQPLSSKQDRDKIKEQEREVQYRHFFTVLSQVPRGSEVVWIRGWPHSSITELPWEGITCRLPPPAHKPSPLPPRFCVCLVKNLPVHSLHRLYTKATTGKRLRDEGLSICCIIFGLAPLDPDPHWQFGFWPQGADSPTPPPPTVSSKRREGS